MAAANTITTYDEVQIKESFSDTISNISPTYTPFISSIGTEKITNTLVNWLEDVLDPTESNPMVEGFIVTPDPFTEPTRRMNCTQIFSRNAEVSRTAQEVALYGRAQELAYQLAKKAKSLKRDLEVACVQTKQVMSLGSKTVAPLFAGAQAQVDPSLIFVTGDNTLDETSFVKALQTCYVNGAEPNTFLINPLDSNSTDAYANNAGRERTIVDGNKTVTNAVQVYASSFGDIKITMDRFIAPGDALVYDPSDWKLLVFHAWSKEAIAKVGDLDQVMIVGEYSLKHSNHLSSAIVRHS